MAVRRATKKVRAQATSRPKRTAKKRTISVRRRRPAPTFIEVLMAAALRRAGLGYHAQFPVQRTGRNAHRRYFLDFALPAAMIAIEADGAAYHSTKAQKLKDARRQAELESQGWTVLRFTGSEIVKDSDACVQVVQTFLKRTFT